MRRRDFQSAGAGMVLAARAAMLSRSLVLAAIVAALPVLSGCQAGATADESDADDPVETEADALSAAWQTGPDVGYGVARQDTHNPIGNNVFIGYAGYNVNRDAACAWTKALY